MRKRSPKSLLLIFGLIFLLLSLSIASSEKIRIAAISFFTPHWKTKEPSEKEELERLRLQNQLLRDENRKFKELLQIDWDAKETVAYAEVIFRSPATWNNFLWINIGSEYNQKAGMTVVAKNSPVLYGRSVVGVIDYVGPKQSRVRLITDSGLTPSVRSLRKKHLLAKGELHGSSKPMWRKQPHLLKGIGFNYDFEDEEGPARDLRTGKSYDPARPVTPMPLIQVNDLLVTTGMDGVFPPGLEVAIVTKIFPLNEGDYYYEIEAKPMIRDFDQLSLLFVIPPIGYENL